jgi:hypothetical protein
VDFEKLTEGELNDYISVDSSNNTQTLTIKFGEAWNFVTEKEWGATDYEGWSNTKQDFFHTDPDSNDGDYKGFWHMLQMVLAFKDREGVTMSGDLSNVIDCAIVRAVQYNQFTMIDKYGTQVPDINEDALHWYLPGQNETESNNLIEGVDYWTSSARTRGWPLYTKSAYYYNTDRLFNLYMKSRTTSGEHILGAVKL